MCSVTLSSYSRLKIADKSAMRFRRLPAPFSWRRSPLTPDNPQKSKNDGLAGKNFSDNSVLTIRRFGSCVLPTVRKNGNLFWLHYLLRNILKFAKNERKKSSKSFSDLLLHVPLRGNRIFSCKIKGGGSTLGYRPLSCISIKTGGSVNGEHSPFTCR